MKTTDDATRPVHHTGTGFRNPWPNSTPQGFKGVVKWMLTRSKQSPGSPADKRLPRISASVRPLHESQKLRVTWIGHSTFLIQCDGLNVLTDPVWSSRASPVQFAGPRRLVPAALSMDELPPIHITFISHDHYDHLDDQSVRQLIRRFPRMQWIAPIGVGHFLRSRGAERVTELDWWDEIQAGDVSVGCTPAQHFSGRYPWNRDSTLWCGYTLQFREKKVFFAGDTALHPEFAKVSKRFGPFDMAILPIGAYEPRWFMRTVHMTPEDSVSAFIDLVDDFANSPCVMVPSHWGTFRLTDEPVMEPPRLTAKTWSESHLPVDHLWILDHGESRTLD